MTTCPKHFSLAAEIAYSTMAHVTDYDVWHESEQPVSVEMVVATMRRNLEIAQKAIAAAIENLDESHICSCHHALDNAIMTARDAITPAALERLRSIVGRARSF
jgi:5'-methylthioadenosine phosphorylase